jgi:mycothiol synthase
MAEAEAYPQLQMIWSGSVSYHAFKIQLPTGYQLRTHLVGDEAHFYEIMDLAGWPGWNDENLAPWLPRILPEGWFMVIHQGTGLIVASCMALISDTFPDSGELGWLVCDPAHQGMGLGMVVTAAVTKRFVEQGYQTIHLYTEHYRLAAIKTYLKLGYTPLLTSPEMSEIWQTVCLQIDWPFTPDNWDSKSIDNMGVPQQGE